MSRIPIAGPWITEKEVEYAADAARNAWYADANKYNNLFEKKFAEYTGRRYAISLPSCTSAIHLALMALGIGKDDEVLVPDLTWIASAAPIKYVGAVANFVDVDADSWCMDADSLEKQIGPKTKAIIPVDLYGLFPDMDAILEIAKKHDLAVIEDSAEAAGCSYKGKKAGSFGDVSVFSFHGTKTLTTGEGGMLLTDDEEIYQKCLFLRDHGRDLGGRLFYHTEVAHKYKMSSMQAAMGLAQLERIDELLERKQEQFGWYKEALAGCEYLTLNYEMPDVVSTYWMVTIIVDAKLGVEKEPLMQALSADDIDTRPIFYPLSSLPAYKDNPNSIKAQKRNVNAYAVAPYGINLPSAFSVTKEQVGIVAQSVLKNIEKLRKA